MIEILSISQLNFKKSLFSYKDYLTREEMYVMQQTSIPKLQYSN